MNAWGVPDGLKLQMLSFTKGTELIKQECKFLNADSPMHLKIEMKMEVPLNTLLEVNFSFQIYKPGWNNRINLTNIHKWKTMFTMQPAKQYTKIILKVCAVSLSHIY